MALNNPTKILKMWTKTHERYGVKEEKGKKLGEKEQKLQKQSEKVEKGLKAIKAVAQTGVATPSQVKKFESTRDKAVRVMMLCCKTLKTLKSEAIQDVTKLRKNARQLTVVVRGLSVQGLDLNEQGDVNLNEFMGVDDAGLDAALDDPALEAAGDIAFDEENEQNEAEAAEIPQAPPAPPPPPPRAAADNLVAQWLQRRKAAEPQLLKAFKEQRGDVSRMRAVFAFATEKADAKQFPAALQALSQLEKLLQVAAGARPGADAAPKADKAAALKNWQAELKNVILQIKAASKAIQAVNDPQAMPVALALESIARQLPPMPNTAAIIANVESYLTGDNVIAAAEECPAQFGTIKIRQPLLGVLQGLK